MTSELFGGKLHRVGRHHPTSSGRTAVDTWTPLGDDDIGPKVADVFESLRDAMREYGAGEATATPKDAGGRALGITSVADLDGLFVGVHIDLEGEYPKVVWAYRG